MNVFGGGNINQIIDSCYTRNSWLLYGSMKDEISGKYQITKILDKDYRPLSLFDAFSDYKIFNYKNEHYRNEEQYFLLSYLLS